MFHAVKETAKHTGAIGLFDLEFGKGGELPRELSRYLHDAFDLRLESDYLGQPTIGPEDAADTLEHAEAFVDRVREHLRKSGASG